MRRERAGVEELDLTGEIWTGDMKGPRGIKYASILNVKYLNSWTEINPCRTKQ